MKGLKDSLQYKSKEQNEGIKARDKFIKDMDLTIPIPINPTLGMGSSEVTYPSNDSVNNYSLGTTIQSTNNLYYEMPDTGNWLINTSNEIPVPFIICMTYIWQGPPPLSGLGNFLIGVSSNVNSVVANKVSTTPDTDGFNFGMINQSMLNVWVENVASGDFMTQFIQTSVVVSVHKDGWCGYEYGGTYYEGFRYIYTSTRKQNNVQCRLRLQAKGCKVKINDVRSYPIYPIPVPSNGTWNFNNGTDIKTFCSNVDLRTLHHVRRCFYLSAYGDLGGSGKVLFGISTVSMPNGDTNTPFTNTGVYIDTSTEGVYLNGVLDRGTGTISQYCAFRFDVHRYGGGDWTISIGKRSTGAPPTESAYQALNTFTLPGNPPLYFFGQVRNKTFEMTEQDY